MTINLSKGQEINLTKGAAQHAKALNNIEFGLGWTPASERKPIDLDASILLLGSNDKMIELVFFNNLTNSNSSIIHSGDDLTGADDGEGEYSPDEIIKVSLSYVPSNVATMFIIVNSYNGQGFGEIIEAFCAVDDKDNKEALAFYDLDKDFSDAQTMVVGKVTRKAENWVFKAVGIKAPSLNALLKSYS